MNSKQFINLGKGTIQITGSTSVPKVVRELMNLNPHDKLTFYFDKETEHVVISK